MTLLRRLIDVVFPRGAFTLSVLSLAYFGMGLVRNRVLSSAFGSSTEYEAYVAAFRIPEIAFDVIVAAGLTAPFVPIFNGLRERDPAAADRFGQTVLTIAVLVMTAIALVLVVVAPVTVELIAPNFDPVTRAQYVAFLRLSCLAQLFFAASFVLGEVLVAHRRFFFYAFAPILYTTGIVAGTILLSSRLGVGGAAVGAVAGAAAHLVVRSIGIARTPFRVAPRLAIRTPAFREFVRLMLPRLVSQPIDPLTVAFFTRLATGVGVGALTAYNYASDYQAVPVSLIGSAFSLAVFPALATAWNDGDGATFRAILRRNVAMVAGLTFAAAIVLAILARPIVSIVHGGGQFGPADVDRTALVLALFAISIPLDSLAYPLSRALYASHNTALQVIASIAGFGAIVAVAWLLSGPFGIAAIPVGYVAGTAAKAALLGAFVRRRLALLPVRSKPAEAQPPAA
jgi:putative peptidoglycan lipid II flippase